MKFISGIQKGLTNADIGIKIPIYHRTSISFFNGSEVYYIYRTYKSNNFNIGELILTPIKPELWHHIRKVTLNAIDGAGIINTITSKLRDLKINVNIEEAITTQIGAIHTVTLIIDISIYIHNHPAKYNTGDKVPESAIKDIENELKNLINPYTKKPIVVDGQISIKELTFLESISNIPANRELSGIHDFQFLNCANQKITIENGRIKLNQKIINGLKLSKESFFYTMLSDTEEKYLKLLFFDKNQTVAFIDILHEDIYGAIAKFTSIIHKNYQFNILASYSHQQMQKEKAHWFGLIDISNRKQQFFTETLDALKTAKYGEQSDKKSAIEVFLIETNIEDVPTDAIKRFGQNRRTQDGQVTSIYSKKQSLILQCLNDYTKGRYLKSPKAFVEQYNLHNTNSLHKLVLKLIKDKNSDKKNKVKKFALLCISVLIPLSILWALMEFIPQIHELVIELFKHTFGLLIAASTIALVYITHKLLKKYTEEE